MATKKALSQVPTGWTFDSDRTGRRTYSTYLEWACKEGYVPSNSLVPVLMVAYGPIQVKFMKER